MIGTAIVAALPLVLASPDIIAADNCSTWYERTQHSTTGVWRSVRDPRFGARGAHHSSRFACRLMALIIPL